MRHGSVLLLLAACGDRDVATQVAPVARVEAPPVPAPRAAARIAPHGTAIEEVALADGGDAALTVDVLARVRLWPTLDGTREPVVVEAPPPRQLALGRAGDELLAVVLDEVGGLELIRVDRSGAPLGRSRIAPEPAFEQIAVVRGGVLAVRGDHTIVWFDPWGRVRGTLVPDPGEKVAAIVARGGVAVAALGERDEVRRLRRVELDGGARWGARFELADPLARPFALSPSGRRIAGLDVRTRGEIAIVELAAAAKVIATEAVQDGVGDHALGFLDDDRLVLFGGTGYTIGGTPPTDPWAESPRWSVRVSKGVAIADGVAVSPTGTMLAISTPRRTQFLGYRDLALGHLQHTARRTVMVAGQRALWLDDELQLIGTTALAPDRHAVQLLVLDERYTIRADWAPHWEVPAGSETYVKLYLFDIRTGEHELGTFPGSGSLAYDPVTQVLVYPSSTATTRLALDLASGTAKPLRPLKASRAAMIRPMDPAQTGGVIAVAHGRAAGGYWIETFTDDGGATTKPLAASSRTKLPEARALGVDRTGTVWTLAAATVQAHRAGQRVASFSVPSGVFTGTVAPGGELVLLEPGRIFAVDRAGAERWSADAPVIPSSSVSSDGRMVYLRSGGLIAFALDTGRHLATRCAWSFELSATEPSQALFDEPVVCGEGP